MKKIFTLCVVLCLSYLSMGATNPKHEFRATWLTTAWGNDWPKTKVTNATTRKQQQDSLIAIFDRLQAGNMNAVCLQVRGRSDAFYQSSYEPWAAELAGARGTDPGYDPLAFAIKEAHKRGLELHAWVNPFRVTSAGTLASTDLVKKNAGQWIIQYNNGSFTGEIIDPGYPEAREYVLNVLMEIISNYDIDGIVMDDYFYPYGGTTTEDAASKALHKPANVVDVNQDGYTDDDWRRSNVDVFLKEFYNRIQTTKPWVRLGMGTFGIWTTQSKVAQAYGISLPSGISGLDDYDEQACNPVEWVKNGYVDYINPQLYWPTTSTRQNYNKLCQWWAKDVCEHFSNQLTNGKKVHFFSSQSISSNSAVSEIQAEIDANRSNLSSGYTGSVFFDTDAYLTMDKDLMTSRFATNALTPPMDWKSNTALAAPTNLTVSGSTLTWQHATAERFTVYAYPKGIGVNTATSNPQYLQAVVYDKSFNTSSLGSLDDITIAVYTYDRYGVEHGVALYNADPNATDDPEPEPEPEPEPSNTITWELNGGEVNTSSIEVPSQSDLMLQFMNNYTSYFGTPTSDIDAFYPSNISGFLYRGFQTRGKFVNEMMLDESAGWKWLADYIVSTSASNPTIVAALNSGTEVNWRYSIAAFFEQNGSGTYNVDFSTAGQPSKWGTAYQIAHGAVLLPTYVTSAFTLPIPTHPEGHDFLGWYDNAEFIGSPLTTISADWTGSLYAKWQEDTPTIDPTWQITYTSTDGNIVTPTQADVFGANIVSNTYENGVGTITFDGPVTSIGECAFLNRNFLYSITIPNRVTSLGDDAFCCCGNLTSIFIPNSVAYIESGVFSSCTSLASIVVEDNNEYYDNRNNCNAIIETKTNTLVAGCKNTIIPNSVTRIGDEAFNGCEFLPFISIPNSVTSIGSYAFYGCSSLTSITIPNSVTSIGKYVFYACRALTSMVIDSDNNHYDSRENCNAIIETATNTLISGCQNTIIPSSVTSIGARAFSLCNSLTSITIPNSVISIWDEAFEECSGLTSITIPNSVTNIGDKAFFYCSNLTSVIIGNSVTSIGNGAFSGCSKLNTIHVEATIPPALEDSTVFMNTPSPTCYIPCGTLAVYEASDWASQVSSFVEDCPPASAAITYVLNGGVQSEWETPQAMYNELNALWNTFSGTSKTWGDLSTLKADVAKGIPTLAYGMALDFIADENFKEKFEWLVTYMDAKCTEQGQTLPSSSAYFLRYNLQAFFIDGMRTSWPISADYTICGVSTVEAYQPYWKSGFANPTNPTEEFVLNAPYKEGYTFAGWYTNAEFSGEKVTTINTETIGTLYAKWVDYIPTIKEVRALANDTKTKVAGVVNHIDGRNIYIQDVTGGILLYTNDTPTCKVGDKIVAEGVRFTYAGVPEVKNAVIESAETATLYDATTFETLTPLISDSIDHKYFATRVTVPGLKIVSYNASNHPTVADNLGNQVRCYNMPLDPVAFPIGKKVTITAVAGGWFNVFQFVGDAAGIELAAGPKKDTYDYPIRDERYTLTNDWIYSNTEGNFAANKPGSNDYVRGMAAKDGIMYFINRENGSLTRVDGATGELLEPLKITGEHLFERIGENGEWESACIFPFNDIKFDQAGNCLIGSLVAGDGTFQIYEVDLETGAATLVVEERLYDNSDFTDNGYRFDAFGVAGDVTQNGVIMAADATSGSWNVYRWLITDGEVAPAEQITMLLDPEYDQSLFINAAGWGTAPQIFPQDEIGSLFYVDGWNMLPMLFDEGGMLVDDFINCPTQVEVTNKDGDVLKMNTGHNGLVEFQVGDEYFLLMASGNTAAAVPSCFALFKFADEGRTFDGLEPLWYFPANGMGTLTNSCRTAPVSVEVEGNKAHLYLYTHNNGYARYTLNVGDNIAEPIDPTWQITYTSTDGNIVTPFATDVFGANIVSNTYENGVGTITFDGPVTSIGRCAFNNCSSLSSIVIPNTVENIGVCAFYGSSIISLDIPNSVTSLGDWAFADTPIESITIPNSVTHIGFALLAACNSLTSIVVEEGNSNYDSRDNCNAIIEKSTNTNRLIATCPNTIIPNTVTTIATRAFQNSAITSIDIPNSVVHIEAYAFRWAKQLNSITIPSSVGYIGDSVFYSCPFDTIRMEAMTPPTIGVNPLSSLPVCVIPCGSLAAYEASAWASQVGEFVEEGCAPIQMCGDDLYWEYADGVLTITGTGDMYDYADDKTGPAPWYDVRGSITTINMPNEMTKIGDYAFYKCTEVTSINMPTTLTAIGEKAFAQDTKLACEIILPASMTTIASRAFFNCQAVTAFHIEATTPPTIPNDAFERTTAPIHVPCGYGHVYGKHAQWGELNLEMCELLQDNVYYYPIDGHTARAVTYHSNPTDTIVIPSAVVIDGMPRTVTEVAASAFADCKDIPAIIFNEGLEYIGERAFVRCYGLQGTIVLPATLETIGERAFSYCDNVEKYLIQAMTPPALGDGAFTCANHDALFYISCEAMADYTVATNWSLLKSRLRDACLNIYHYNTSLGANGVYTTEDTLVASIFYRRQFTPYRWETLYLPFEVDRVTVLEDGEEYDLKAWDIKDGGHYFIAKPDGWLNMEIIFGFTDELDAHTPYIIQFKDDYYRDKIITFYGKESWNKLSTSFEVLSSSSWMQIAGNTTMQDQLLEKPVYMLRSGLDFILQKTTTTLHPFECYVMPYATPSGTPARMNVRFRGDVPTAVESVKGNESHLTYTVDGYTLTVYPQGQAFSIYSLNGALIYSCEAGKEAVDCELNSGCYLLHAGAEAHKIML